VEYAEMNCTNFYATGLYSKI